MKIIECEQGSEEWRLARSQRVTASRVADVMAKIKFGEAATRRKYRTEILATILTNNPPEPGYTNPAMEWGKAHEAEARTAFEVETCVAVNTVGFVIHPTIGRAGCSPDGLIGSDGLVEIKCPDSSTHLETLITKQIDAKYITQMQFQMACCEREWCDFVSFDPRFPSHLQLFVKRVFRDDARIKEIEDEVRTFLSECSEILDRLNVSVPVAAPQAAIRAANAEPMETPSQVGITVKPIRAATGRRKTKSAASAPQAKADSSVLAALETTGKRADVAEYTQQEIF